MKEHEHEWRWSLKTEGVQYCTGEDCHAKKSVKRAVTPAERIEAIRGCVDDPTEGDVWSFSRADVNVLFSEIDYQTEQANRLRRVLAETRRSNTAEIRSLRYRIDNMRSETEQGEEVKRLRKSLGTAWGYVLAGLLEDKFDDGTSVFKHLLESDPVLAQRFRNVLGLEHN